MFTLGVRPRDATLAELNAEIFPKNSTIYLFSVRVKSGVQMKDVAVVITARAFHFHFGETEAHGARAEGEQDGQGFQKAWQVVTLVRNMSQQLPSRIHLLFLLLSHAISNTAAKASSSPETSLFLQLRQYFLAQECIISMLPGHRVDAAVTHRS